MSKKVCALTIVILTALASHAWSISVVVSKGAGHNGQIRSDDWQVPPAGDLDLDGMTASAGDLAAMNMHLIVLSNCIIDPPPYPPTEVTAQADINCDETTWAVSDLVELWNILLGKIEPCYLPTAVSVGGRHRLVESLSASDNYFVKIQNTQFVSEDTGWVDLVLTEATAVFCGFQFHLEYDPAHLQLLEIEAGDVSSRWSHVDYHDSSSGTVNDLRIAGVADDFSEAPDLTLPPLPSPVVRLKFAVVSLESNFQTDINFVWDDCGDNNLVPSTSGIECGAHCPLYTSVSRHVYDPDMIDITGSSDRYGGVDDICVLGGPQSTPLPVVNFKSGRVYRLECCQGRRGNTDGLTAAGGDIDVADLSYLVNYLFKGGPKPPCPEEGNVDAVAGSGGPIDVGDLTYLVDFLFRGGPEPPGC